ncbi:MAG: hypothetical protein IJE74_03985 [Clostridia bacterium]|nr:hypothetical protein [Clostridia bacterium]
MAEYNRSEAYDLSLYDLPALNSSSAPKLERKPQPQKARPKTAAQIRRESISSALRALKLFAVSVTLVLLFGAVLISKISLVLIENEAAALEAKMNEARSENTRLVMQLNSSASIDKVDAYAVSVLGMHKLERYQIHYFGNRDGDRVVVADGKAVEYKANADG